MAEDVKATRLSKAAHEFNVGIATIVEFLHKKGFDLDPNPNTKLPHEAYLLLLKEYSSDLNVKKESEKLILKDLHRKKETVSIDDFSDRVTSEDLERDDEILIKDTSLPNKGIDIMPEIKKVDIKLVGKIDLDKTLKPKTQKPAAPAEVQEKKIHKEAPAQEVTEKKKAVDAKEKETVKEPAKEDQKSSIDIHIVGKIDLETVKKEGKAPKKGEKGKAKEKAKEPEAAGKEEKKGASRKAKDKVEETVAETQTPEPKVEEGVEKAVLTPEEEETIEVYKPEFKKMSGLTVVGKIDLPVEEKKKPVPYQQVKIDGESDFRRRKKRKRITKEKEQVPVVKPVSSDKKGQPGKRIIKKRAVRT
jgi:translation initiation factor IF-2